MERPTGTNLSTTEDMEDAVEESDLEQALTPAPSASPAVASGLLIS